MPELPDVAVYVQRLEGLLSGSVLQKIRLASPFLLRSFDPPLRAVEGRQARGFRRLGKRIVWAFDADLFLVLHLMIAGRLHWRAAGCAVPRKAGLAAFDFEHGTVLLTEAGTTRRASLHLVSGIAALSAHDPGGLEVLEAPPGAFAARLRERNHTLKRALTDPTLFSGIGNAYSDEILHRARLSPIAWTSRTSDEEVGRLWQATRDVLQEWTEKLAQEVGSGFPENVTAFRPDMAVHGRYLMPCPDCGSPVQRIRYANNECNYCASCQTGGRLLADRGLSRLLKDDWPRTLEELEERLSSR